MTTRLDRKGRKKRKIRVFRIFLLLFFIIAASTGYYFYDVYSNVASAVDKMNNSFDRDLSKKRDESIEFHRKDPISILLVGVDEREGDSGRTDSMIIVTINPDTQSTKLLSIPRDTRTKLIDNNNPNKDRISKINAAYAYGGIEMTIDTVENFLNIPIDYYTEVNMEGFKDIVDAVGGIDVDNKYAFELDGVTLETGPQHLNGEKSLQYARMRKQDPNGDFGRQERQKEVIVKVIDKGKKISSLVNYDKILKALENNVKTNLTLDDMIGIQAKYKAAANDIEKIEMSGEGQNIPDDGWYFMVSDETRQELSDKLRNHLGLPYETVSEINLY